MTQQLIVILHVLVAFAIIGLILIQQGKGANMGASFGSGASQTVMGSQGSGGVFLKITALLSVVFFITSFTLAVMAKGAFKDDDYDIPTVEQVKEMPSEEVSSEVPVAKESTNDEIPTAEQSNEATSDEIPTIKKGELPEVPIE